jgi:hypothetical protein
MTSLTGRRFQRTHSRGREIVSRLSTTVQQMPVADFTAQGLRVASKSVPFIHQSKRRQCAKGNGRTATGRGIRRRSGPKPFRKAVAIPRWKAELALRSPRRWRACEAPRIPTGFGVRRASGAFRQPEARDHFDCWETIGFLNSQAEQSWKGEVVYVQPLRTSAELHDRGRFVPRTPSARNKPRVPVLFSTRRYICRAP